MKLAGLLALLLGVGVGTVYASPAVETLLQRYQQEGAAEGVAARGEALWLSQVGGRSCTDCHTSDPKQPGEHVRTGKPIEPLAPSVNPSRLQEVATLQKWLQRNCRWTFGRECSAQEKSDLLAWLVQQ